MVNNQLGKYDYVDNLVTAYLLQLKDKLEGVPDSGTYWDVLAQLDNYSDKDKQLIVDEILERIYRASVEAVDNRPN